MRGFLKAAKERASKMDLAEKTQSGGKSTTSMNNVARDASASMSTAKGLLKLFGLEDSLSGQPTDVAKTVISHISGGNIDPAFLARVLPIIGTQLPMLMKNSQGLALLQLLNNLYANHRFDLSDFEQLGLDEEAKRKLKTFKLQYDAQGINGVDITNLTSMIGKINLDKLGELAEPMKRLLHNVLEKRVFTIAMFEEAMKGTHRNTNTETIDGKVHNDETLGWDA